MLLVKISDPVIDKIYIGHPDPDLLKVILQSKDAGVAPCLSQVNLNRFLQSVYV